jgi:ATP phosphoribosyltransferase
MERSQRNGLLGNPNNPSEAARYMYGHGYSLLYLAQIYGEEEDLDRRRKLEDMKMLLEGAMNALGKVGLMLNVHKDDLAAVLGVLPALKRPTISHLSDDQWLAVNTILDESTVRDIIPRLKQAGGQGIVEYPLNKIVL